MSPTLSPPRYVSAFVASFAKIYAQHAAIRGPESAVGAEYGGGHQTRVTQPQRLDTSQRANRRRVSRKKVFES